jgi:hypothetical protein
VSSCTPLSTTRAAAHSGGWVCLHCHQHAGWHLSHPSVPVFRCSRAPTCCNHPTSSCLWQWCGVLVVPSSPSSLRLPVSLLCPYHSCGTPFHPTSNCSWQWLGVLHGAGVIVSLSPRPPSLSSPLPIVVPPTNHPTSSCS